MVSRHHRFLHQQETDSARTERIWVLHGPQTGNLFFHDLYRGCVTLRRTVELWGTRSTTTAQAPFTVTLTRAGELDFGGNADPAAARARFEAMRSRRPAPPGQRRRTRRTERTTQTTEETEAAAEAAAEGAAASVGSGQGLINRMQQLTGALVSTSDRVVVIVDALSTQLRLLHAQGQAVSVLQAEEILNTDWVRISPNNGPLVFLEYDRSELERHLRPDQPAVWWRDQLRGPAADEIDEALHRSSRRKDFVITNSGGVAQYLAKVGGLREALGQAFRAVSSNRSLTLEGIMDLPPIDQAAVDRILAELDAFTGLDAVKAKARELCEQAKVRRGRLVTGEMPVDTMHMVFTGGPGTGKTSVAKIFARLYHALGLLPTDRVRVVAPHEIKATAVGRTGENLQRVVEEAVGGVLFIDEAHQFSAPGVGEQDDSKSREAAQALVPAAWNHRGNLVIILAGYATQIHGFFQLDEGLDRRFPEALRVEFADYTPDQLWEILQRKVSERGFRVAPEAEAPLRRLVAQRSRRAGFGNAGGVDNLVTEVANRHDARGGTSQVLTGDDVPPAVVRHPEQLAAARRKLDALVGIAPIRTMVDEMAYTLEYDSVHGDSGDKPPKRMLFVGPPGTGKTTVAELMADLLYGLGVLTSNKCVPLTGSELLGQFVGHAQANVVEVMKKARDGVLFIDEAYSMMSGNDDGFGSQAVDTLVGELTKPENADTLVILAGYEDQIDELVRMNPGLRSRAATKLRFTNFTSDECVEIARRQLSSMGYTPGEGLLDGIRLLAESAMTAQGTEFGNARWVTTTVATAQTKMKVRVIRAQLALTDPRARSVELIDLINAVGDAAGVDRLLDAHADSPAGQ